MKEIVPFDLLKNYLTDKAATYDDFLALRRVLSYQYGTVILLHHILSVETALPNLMINLKTGFITICSLPFNYKPQKLSPFSLRLSTNFYELFGNTYINAGILPSFIATADALNNSKYIYFNIDLISKRICSCCILSWDITKT